MQLRILALAAVAVACNTDGHRDHAPSMADLVQPADRPPPPPPRPPPDPRSGPVAAADARMRAAIDAAHGLPTAAARRAELRRRLGTPSLELDGWIEWAVADDESCATLWIERVDADAEQHRYESTDPDDGSARAVCSALAAGDARARIVGDVAHAHGTFADAAAARAWLARALHGGPSQQKSIDGVRRSRWAVVVGETCFQVDVYDDDRGRELAGTAHESYEDDYALCTPGAAHAGA